MCHRNAAVLCTQISHPSPSSPTYPMRFLYLIFSRITLFSEKNTPFRENHRSSYKMGRCFVNLCAKLHQLCLIVFYYIDCSPPGSSVHGILQARILEWVAISSSRESFQPRDGTCVLYISYLCPLYCQVGSLPLALFWTSM